MSSILSRLPMSALEATSTDTQAYLSALKDALEDGRIIGDEARHLARVAGRAGLGSAQVVALNEQFLETMREAAFDDAVLTTSEISQFRKASNALGVDGYLDDLQPTPPSKLEPSPAANTSIPSTILAKELAAPDDLLEVAAKRRCGHCRRPDHYRTRCPSLSAA